MTAATKMIGAALLLAVSVRPAPAPAPAPTPASTQTRPRIESGSFETRVVAGGALAREVSGLRRRQGGPVWAGYAVPAVEGDHRMCCWESIDALERAGTTCGRCNLEGKGAWSSSTNDGDDKANDKAKVSLEPRSDEFLVLFRVDGEGVDQIRIFSMECQLDAGKRPFVWLTGVDPGESLDWLSSFVDDREKEDKEDLSESAIMAIAHHGGQPADRLLANLTSSSHPSSVREHAIFWMGQARGRAGYEVVRRIARDDASTEIRKKGIFALSQSPVAEATDDLIRLAHVDRESEVRGEALFWLAQKAGERAVRALSDAIDNDPEIEVKKKAVFGLSQLDPDEGVPLLIGIAKSHRSAEVRREAIFWLGQSGDPRALDLIEEILR